MNRIKKFSESTKKTTTVTKEEKIAAYRSFLECLESSNGKVLKLDFILLEPNWRRWI